MSVQAMGAPQGPQQRLPGARRDDLAPPAQAPPGPGDFQGAVLPELGGRVEEALRLLDAAPREVSRVEEVGQRRIDVEHQTMRSALSEHLQPWISRPHS